MPELTPSQALNKLLIRLFSAAELREFVRFGPDASGIYPWLPEREASLAELALEIVDLFERRGSIDAALFHRLRRERPARTSEIDAVARRFLREHGDQPEANATGPVPGATPPPVDLASASTPAQDLPAPGPASAAAAKAPAGPQVIPLAPPAASSPPTRPRSPRLAILVGVALLVLAAIAAFLPEHCSHGPGASTIAQPIPGPRAPDPPPPSARDAGGSSSTAQPDDRPLSEPVPASDPVGAPPPPDPVIPPRDGKKLRRTITQATRSRLQACSDRAGALEPQTVMVALRIDAHGKIVNATASGTSYGSAFHDCVAAAVESVRLSPGPIETATYRWDMR